MEKETRNIRTSTLSDTVKDALSNIYLQATSRKNYDVLELNDDGKNSCIVISNNLSQIDMERIAEKLSMEDLVCETAGIGANFLIVRENPTPTSKKLIEKFDKQPCSITRIPITLAEGLEISKYFGKNIGVIENGAGENTFILVPNSNVSDSRKSLSELAHKLCRGGLLLTHMQNSNFIVVQEATTVTTTERLSEEHVVVEDANALAVG